jgi:hypothetical protein
MRRNGDGPMSKNFAFRSLREVEVFGRPVVAPCFVEPANARSLRE